MRERFEIDGEIKIAVTEERLVSKDEVMQHLELDVVEELYKPKEDIDYKWLKHAINALTAIR